jgi:hypothetical protein
MFVQYNIIEKILRILIFAVAVYLSLQYIPNNELEFYDKVKILPAIVLIFVVYELYYPQVRVTIDQ